MNRRNFIKTTGLTLAAVLINYSLTASTGKPIGQLISFPDEVSAIINDQWERTYGDVSWHKILNSEILPWYFIEYDGNKTNGFGVKTGAKSFCFWQLSEDKLSLKLDLRSGGMGVQLSDIKLKAAEIVTLKSNSDESAFQAARRFTKLMCDKARMPKQPEATGTVQKTAIKECFKIASQNLVVGEPLDWMETAFPEKWRLNGKIEAFDWN